MASLPKRLTAQDVEVMRQSLPGLRRTSPSLADILQKIIEQGSPYESEFVTVGAAAKTFGVSDQTIRDWVDKGWLDAEFTPGGHRRIPASALANARALAQPRPPVREMSDEERQAIIEGVDLAVAVESA